MRTDSGLLDQGQADMADMKGADMAPEDMAAEDMAAEDMGEAEMGVDPACMFIDLDAFYYKCGRLEDFLTLRKFEDPQLGAARCPEFYVMAGQRYPSAQAALQAQSCDMTCRWAPFMSVSMLHCGQRTGYIQWTSPTPTCEPIFEFAQGVYPSVERWQMAHPCPG